MDKRGKSLFNNTLILSFGTFCTKGIMFLMTPLFTRWLSQSEYGIFDLILTYIGLLIPLVTLEASEAVYRFLLDAKESEFKKIISNSLFIAIIGITVSLILSIIVVVFFNSKLIAVLIIFLTLFECLNNYLNMTIRGLKKLNLYALSNILFCISMVTSTTIYIKIFNLGLNGILFGYLTGYILNSTFSIIFVKPWKYVSFKEVEKKYVIKMLKYALPLIPMSISWWVMNVSDRTIVSIFLGTSYTAILAVANKIPNICQTFFSVFHLSWQQSAIESKNDEDKVEFYNSIFNKMIIILSSIIIVIMSGNFLIFKILFKEEYFSAFYHVPILLVAIVISLLCQFIGAIYIANMNSKKNGTTTIMAAIVNIITHLILIKYIGLYAASISTLISYITLLFIRYRDIQKYTKLNVDKGSIRILFVVIYFIITTYLNISFINYINIVLSILAFYIVNREIVNKSLNKIFRKINNKN